MNQQAILSVLLTADFARRWDVDVQSPYLHHYSIRVRRCWAGTAYFRTPYSIAATPVLPVGELPAIAVVHSCGSSAILASVARTLANLTRVMRESLRRGKLKREPCLRLLPDTILTVSCSSCTSLFSVFFVGVLIAACLPRCVLRESTALLDGDQSRIRNGTATAVGSVLIWRRLLEKRMHGYTAHKTDKVGPKPKSPLC